jgi:hypothetical protein
MSYHCTTLDIIVGVGMCAIVVGVLLCVGAANGTLQTAALQSMSSGQPSDSEFGMTRLQPVQGQAIVDQALFERRAILC